MKFKTATILTLALSILGAMPALADVFESVVVGVDAPGLSREELTEIEKALGIGIDRPLDYRRLDDGIRKLHRQGEMQTLFVEGSPSGNGIKVLIRATKLRRLRQITFSKVEPEVLEEVRRKLPLEEGEATDMRTFGILKERLKAAYENRGFPFASVEIRVNEIKETNEADVEVIVEPGSPTLVSKVMILGVPKEDLPRLRSLVSIKRGDRFSKAAVDESIESINQYLRANQYPTSKVQDTSISFSPDKLQVEVGFSVRMGERFQFEFSGNSVFRDSELRELLTDEALAQPDVARRVSEQIQAKYRSVGYHWCTVTPQSVPSPRDRLSVIRFQITEGPKVLVDHVDFTNVGSLDPGDLEDWFYEAAPGILGRRVYWEEGVKEAVKGLQKKLVSLGYLNGVVNGPRTIFSDDRKGAQLFFDLDAGVRTNVSQVEYRGFSYFSESEMDSLQTFKTGDSLDRAQVEETRAKILTRYQEEGYVDARFADGSSPDGVTLSADRRRAVVTHHISEGPQYFVGNVTIEGTRKTQDEVILREMKLKKGDKFNPVLLRQSEENIAGTGLFSRVEMVPSSSSEAANRKDLKIVVRETKPGVGEVGLGAVYEEPRLRLRPFFGITYRNLFGLNHSASARSEISFPLTRREREGVIPFIEYALLFGYSAPYPFGVPVTASSQVGLDRFEVSNQGGKVKVQTRARLEEKLEKRISRPVTLFYRLHRFERTKTEILDDPTKDDIETIGSTGPGVIFDFRNDIFNPTKGSLHSAEIELAHPVLLSQSDPKVGFVMVSNRNSFYFPLFNPFSFTFYAGAGYAKSLFDDSPLPTARLVNDLSLGGQSSIRGFDIRSFTPSRDNRADNPRETAFYNLRAELGIYLFYNISAAIFMDSGQIFPEWRSDPRHDGVGVGLRYKTPVGPVVIDIARGLGEEASGVVKFYFTVGTI